MNVGQVLETHLGIAAKALGFKVATPVFDGIKEEQIFEYIRDAKKVEGFSWISDNGKATVYDGRTGDPFDQQIVVGIIYMLKLGHPWRTRFTPGRSYLLAGHQQPLGGKAQYGGQRFAKWSRALEAYAQLTLAGAAHRQVRRRPCRTRIYESIVKGDNSLEAGTPESLTCDQGNAVSCLDVEVEGRRDHCAADHAGCSNHVQLRISPLFLL